MENEDHTVMRLSGLELLKAMAEGKRPMPSMVETIPMAVVSVEAGLVRFSATAGKRHLNPLGGVHGSFINPILRENVCNWTPTPASSPTDRRTGTCSSKP